MCCNLLQVRDLRLCCIISNVRFPTAIGNLHTPKGSRQQDVRLKGSQSPHSVLCKYLCSTFWRAKINFTTKLCVCTLCVCACVCVYNTCLLSFAVASCRHVTCVCAVLSHPRYASNTCRLLVDQVVRADPLLTPPRRGFIHSFIHLSERNSLEFTWLFPCGIVRASANLPKYFTNNTRGQNAAKT